MHFGQYYGSSAALGYITGMYMYTDNYANLYGFFTITRYTQLLCTMLSTMYAIRISYRDRHPLSNACAILFTCYGYMDA